MRTVVVGLEVRQRLPAARRAFFSAVIPNNVIGLTWPWERSEGVAILSFVERRWLVKWKQEKCGTVSSTLSGHTDLASFRK